jgi:thiosulfate/3-mercaptopyruvate sulfurtransferase
MLPGMRHTDQVSEPRGDDPLTDAGALRRRLDGPRPPTVLDVRFHLGGPPGHGEYLAGHIPGAVYLDVDSQLCGPPGPGGRHPLPDPAALQAALRGCGVRADTPVVTYDSGDGWAAARLWWTLRWAGHAAVTVLDGGFAAWLSAGGPVETGQRRVEEGDITVRPGQMPVLDADGAARTARDGVLLDVRTPVRYRGEAEPIDPVAGHIPGAVNLPDAELVGPGGRLLDPQHLGERFAAAGVAGGVPVGAYCGSGLTAARTVLALTRVGVAAPALYVGSWSHWITAPDRPVAGAAGGGRVASDAGGA